MKLKDLIQKIDKTFKNDECIRNFAYTHFQLNIEWQPESALTYYDVTTWICTDTHVGMRVYFLYDEPVCVSYQNCRKCEENFEWFSKELRQKVRNYILTLEQEEDDYQIADMEEEHSCTYKVEYYEQLKKIHYEKAIYNGINAKIINVKHETSDNIYHTRKTLLEIQFENNETKWVDIKEIHFRYNLIY